MEAKMFSARALTAQSPIAAPPLHAEETVVSYSQCSFVRTNADLLRTLAVEQRRFGHTGL